MKSLVLTLDYELYGNGSGNVFSHIIEPTNILLDIAQKHGVHFTFFFEVIEYWKLKEEWEKGNTMGYTKNPILAIEEQLCRAYCMGHDIQLHLHPQWIDAYFENQLWHVNNKEWKLGTYCRSGELSLENLLKKGKSTIAKILSPVCSDYHCIALRAGGYNVQPSMDIVRAMLQTGIYVDSSIYPGGKESGTLSVYDYTSIAPDKEYWHTNDRLETEGNGKIIELPIVAFPISRIAKYASTDRIKSFLQNKKSAKETFDSKTGGEKSTLWKKFSFFLEKECQTWDFCLFSTFLHNKFLHQIERQNRKIAVLVGHPKSFITSKGLEYLLNKTKTSYTYPTISDIYNIIK